MLKDILKLVSDLSLPFRQAEHDTNRMELAPFLSDSLLNQTEVVKASSGHYPLPFLISIFKELLQRYKQF
jgi:hypothetical protein